MTVCEICKKEHHKYKCPCCLLRYCSLPCFRSHKESGCEKPAPAKLEASDDRPSSASKLNQSMESETLDTVKPEVLEKLAHNEELKALLANPHLQTIITHLDTTKTTQKAIQDAMREPIFVEFADQCLRMVEPETAVIET